MTIYHAVFIIRYNFINNDYDINSLVSSLNAMTNKEIEIFRSEYWGLLNFAYPISKKKRGHYVSVFFDSSLKHIEKIKHEMKMNEEIVRYMICKINKVPEQESVLAQEHKKSLEEKI